MTTEAPETEQVAPAVEPEETPEPPTTETVEAPSTDIEIRTPKGFLTFRPNQTTFDENQRATLVAIGIDTKQDPGIVPHALVFLHMCQSQGLDPYRREAYLIARGKDQNRKYTMQTGIDGYRKMAARTGRLIRVLDILWTGADDDDRSYRMDAGGVMRRVWYDQWPASRGYPGAAKAVIQHYDESGSVVTTEAVADWTMYAPFSPKYEGYGQNRKKARNPDGTDVMVLNDMWEKGYAHMLAKCAEALAYRRAFPASMGGFVTHEEMHRADQIERDRLTQVQAAQRRQAFEAAQTSTRTLPVPEPQEADLPEGAAPTGPMTVGEVLPEVVPESTEAEIPADEASLGDDSDAVDAEVVLSPEERVVLLRKEVAFQAKVLGSDVATMARRHSERLGKPAGQFTDVELLAVVAPLRNHVVDMLAAEDRFEEAEAYSNVQPGDVVDVETLVPATVDPTQAHAYADQGGVCRHCERIEDDKIHAVT